MNISVWDDDTETAIDWKNRIDSILNDHKVTVEAHKRTDITNDLEILHQRRKIYLSSNQAEEHNDYSRLDQTDILVVDNDLFDLEGFNDYSAEMVATRACVYTDCKYVIVLNLNPDLDFDLSLLGHPDSKANLHINDQFVDDEGLWKQCPKNAGDFRPWHWPLLGTTALLHTTQAAQLQQLLTSESKDMPILDFFGFPETARNRLSRSARAFLHPRRKAEEVSFIDFIDGNARAVNLRDGQEILNRNDTTKIARIAAHRISKWLQRLVLAPQDILIDVPHLVEKLPFLIPDEHQDSLDYWNTCATLSDAATTSLHNDFAAQPFEHKQWFDRPVFWAEDFDTVENLDKLLAATDSNPNDFVFCEDSSAFHPSRDCDRFVAAHHSTSDHRFIRWLNGDHIEIKYGPQSRLAM